MNQKVCTMVKVDITVCCSVCHLKAKTCFLVDGFYIGGSDEVQEGVWMWADSGR